MKTKSITKIETEEASAKLAVLIDADNAQPSIFKYLLPEIAKYGEATVKRIYGDFTSSQSAQWRSLLNKFAIKPVQQFSYTTGKNATDSMLIIDAMDLMYTRRFDGFCIISSDSDFTSIATRIREEGLSVYGFGKKNTPEAFKNACHVFVDIEILVPQENKKNVVEKTSGKTEQQKNNSCLPLKDIEEALEQSSDDSGWSQIGTFGSKLLQLKSDFDSRQYGFKKLSELVKNSKDIFEIQERKQAHTDSVSIYLRMKK
ncbi:MAG: NYN domain-containing protein [Fibrobacteraceae bacterium]|nr:NYN domain-containing protein [Fibrobacteraceae bacterium]